MNNEYFDIISLSYLGLENCRQSYLSFSLIIVPLVIGQLSTSPTVNSPLPSETHECASLDEECLDITSTVSATIKLE